MRNKILMIVTAIIVICLIVVAFLFFKNKPDDSIPTSSTILLPTNNSSGNISANNYYTASSNVIDEKDVLMETNENFDILAYHYNNQRTFSIYLKQSNIPLETNRQNAEDALLKKLGITKEQACSLVVSLSLANDIQGSTTEDYGLSFCPNGKALPLSKS